MFGEPEARSGTRKPVVLAELRKDGLSDPSGSLPSASSKIGGLCRDQWKDGEVPAARSSPPGEQAQLFREQQLGLPLRAGDAKPWASAPALWVTLDNHPRPQALVSLSVDLSLVVFFSGA